MTVFSVGFISCWCIMAILFVLCELDIISETSENAIAFPILLLYIPIATIKNIIKSQWQNVIKPISADRWRGLISAFPYVKYKHIKNIYIVWDKRAKGYRKMCFIRVKGERENDG